MLTPHVWWCSTAVSSRQCRLKVDHLASASTFLFPLRYPVLAVNPWNGGQMTQLHVNPLCVVVFQCCPCGPTSRTARRCWRRSPSTTWCRKHSDDSNTAPPSSLPCSGKNNVCFLCKSNVCSVCKSCSRSVCTVTLRTVLYAWLFCVVWVDGCHGVGGQWFRYSKFHSFI